MTLEQSVEMIALCNFVLIVEIHIAAVAFIIYLNLKNRGYKFHFIEDTESKKDKNN